MATTDLTGTTWRINNAPVISDAATYYINFVDANNGNYTRLSFSQASSILYRVYQSDWSIVYDSRGWGKTYYQTITISDGTDATNPALIAWLESNAIQVVVGNKLTVTSSELTAIADAIRTKTGQSGSLVYPNGFISAINSISGDGYTVTVSLTNPISPSDFISCDIYPVLTSTETDEDIFESTPIGAIGTASGSTTVAVDASYYGIGVLPNGNWGASYSEQKVTTTEGVSFIRMGDEFFPYMSVYSVGGNGTITINGIDYGD